MVRLQVMKTKTGVACLCDTKQKLIYSKRYKWQNNILTLTIRLLICHSNIFKSLDVFLSFYINLIKKI